MAGLTEPRWTHVALPVSDLDRSIAFFEELTPLVLVRRNENDTLRGAWLSNKGQVETPFVLVLGSFKNDEGVKYGVEPGKPMSILNPWAHLGIELPHREDVDRIAVKAREMGCTVAWGPMDMGGDIGYTFAVTDPDGNTIEFAHNQQIFSTIQDLWG